MPIYGLSCYDDHEMTTSPQTKEVGAITPVEYTLPCYPATCTIDLKKVMMDRAVKIIMRRSTSRYTILSVLVLFVLLKLDNLTEHHLQHHSSGNIDEVNQETFIENHRPPSAATPSRLRRRNLQVFSRLGSYLDPKSIALREHHAISPPPPPPPQQQQQHETKVSYITSFWAKPPNEQVNPHRREVEAALLTNIHNPHFDQIVVFLDTHENAISE
jgi:hypothetical protein